MRLRHAAGQADGQQDCGMRVEWGIGVGNLAGGRLGGAQNPLRGASLAHAPGRRADRSGWDNGGWLEDGGWVAGMAANITFTVPQLHQTR